MKIGPFDSWLRLAFVLLAGVGFAADTMAQIALIHNPRPRISRPTPEYRIAALNIDANINDQVATVQMAQLFENTSRRTLETQFVFPLPADAAVNGLTLIVDGKELPGELKRKEQARSEYEAIVRKQKDPALLEYIGQGLFKTSVFPIPAGATRRVEIRYTQLLKSDFGLIDLTLPLGTARHCERPIDEVNVTVRIRAQNELQNVYSPTHDFDIDRPGSQRARCSLKLSDVRKPDDIRLLYGTEGGEVGVNLVSYHPDEEDEQGYFLLMASPKMKLRRNDVLPKTVVFVVDRSGSMSGEKLKQAKASLKYMIDSLNDEDTFNIVSYSSGVEMFRPELEEVTAETRKEARLYVDDIYAGGGTNINQALTDALNHLQDSSRPNYVLFLTDGLPTVGVTQETKITANVKEANQVKARIFSFGVGYDVNSRLLDRLSHEQRGTSVFVKPEEDIEVAATNLFRKVSAPAMTDVQLKFVSSQVEGNPVNRLIPGDLPDLFQGEQLLVVGRYKKAGPVTIRLRGKIASKTQTLEHEGQFGDADNTARNAFVETLWATRRIGQIINELDLHGRNSELIDELVSLSLKHGIMTPYTSFLADETVSFEDRRRLMTEAQGLTDELSVAIGRGGFQQREFKQSLQQANRAASGGYGGGASAPSPSFFGGRSRSVANRTSRAAGAGLADKSAPGRPAATPKAGADADAPAVAEQAEEATPPETKVRRIGNRTFYWKNQEWQDAELADRVNKSDDLKIVKVEQFSREYFELASRDNGRWAKYLSVDKPLLIEIEGTVYRIVPPTDKSP